MNNFEKLLAEYDKELLFKFRKDMPNGLPALLVDKTIYINPEVEFNKAIEYVAEEIGHHNTLADGVDISDYKDLNKYKLEKKGRECGYKKLVPKEKLIDFISVKEQVMPYEIAEEFGLTDDYIAEAVNMYKVKGEL